MAARAARRRGGVLALVLIGVTLLATACGGGDGPGSTTSDVRPFASVQASEFAFEADPTNPQRGMLPGSIDPASVGIAIRNGRSTFIAVDLPEPFTPRSSRRPPPKCRVSSPYWYALRTLARLSRRRDVTR
jgi:hypothetical protein